MADPYDRFLNNPRPRLPYRARPQSQAIEYEHKRQMYDVPKFDEPLAEPVYRVTVIYEDPRPITIERPYIVLTEPWLEDLHDRYAAQELPNATSYRGFSNDDEELPVHPIFKRKNSGEPVMVDDLPGYIIRTGHYVAMHLDQKSEYLTGRNQYRRSNLTQWKREHLDHVLYHGNNRVTEIYGDSRTGGITTHVYR
ncbi:uncharacterized protein LOC127870227 [Dreissena polymorpha]|uniref:Uncharacterized protein n=1 Tax=Dreissena polymorpha TaxID=45954 RepID=A0A9D4LLH4_DREPO|nr:uncharacterized protein LOC127870227 [Dreissena polymorpha]KAH3860074.1 hypothetical protein DPMN_022967 [Dreissena polymorpha]